MYTSGIINKNKNMPKTIIMPAMLALVGVFVFSGCGSQPTSPSSANNSESAKNTQHINICDENGNIYTTEQEAKAAGLSESQYGATYCQYFDENGNEIADNDTTTTTQTNQVYTKTMKAPIEATPLKTVPPTVSTEKFSKKEQLTGSKKHNDFILEHVKHNNTSDKYVIDFKLDRKHDAKTHAAPYTIATYHAHDSKHNNGRIEVEMHEVNKNNFDVTKIVKPKHNKYIKDIEMSETNNKTRALFIIHLNEKASGKFNLSSTVMNNQNVTITLDVLE